MSKMRQPCLATFICRLYRRALRHGSQKPTPVRLMICGPFGVGKSSVFRSLRWEQFKPRHDSTEGVHINKSTLGRKISSHKAALDSVEEADATPAASEDRSGQDPEKEEVVVTPEESLASLGKEETQAVNDALLKTPGFPRIETLRPINISSLHNVKQANWNDPACYTYSTPKRPLSTRISCQKEIGPLESE